MKIIAFYISNHGFGHASRNITIIEELCRSCDVRIIIKTGKNQLDFMKQSLSYFSSKISFYESLNDLGLILKNNSIEVDFEKMKENLEEFLGSFDIRAEKEAEFLLNNNVDLVVSDITPWIFKACRANGVNSVLISNFTWVEIYKELGLKDISESYKNLYSLADKVLVYPVSTGFEESYKDIKYVGLTCRKFNECEVDRIRKLTELPKVYVSVGRSVDLINSIDVSCLPYTFIYTEGINITGENTIRLPLDTPNTHDYIKASDYIITKAGWGTVAEALAAKRPMLVLRRDEIYEDRMTLKKLIALKAALPIAKEQLNSKDIDMLLKQLHGLEHRLNENNKAYNIDNEKIAREIYSLI